MYGMLIIVLAALQKLFKEKKVIIKAYSIMNEVYILNLFKTQLLAFCDELVHQFPREAEFTLIKIFLKDSIPTQKAMTLFNKAINKDSQNIKKMIHDRNDNFFINHNPFNFLTDHKGSISKLTLLWQDETLSDENKDVIWKWVDVFVKISDKYDKIRNI